MNVLAIVSAAIIGIAGCASAQDTSDRDFLVSYLENNQCVVSMTDIRNAFDDAGRYWKLAQPTAIDLIGSGDAVLLAPLETPENHGSRVALQSGETCSNFPVKLPALNPALTMTVIEVFETNDCVLEDGEEATHRIWEQLQETNSEQEIADVFLHFMNNGQLEFTGPFGGTITFTGSELCNG